MKKKILREFPHVVYNEKGIGAIDFHIEDLPISKDRKTKLATNFVKEKGIFGYLPTTKKLIKFTPNKILIVKNVPQDKELILPNVWQKRAVILNNLRRKEMKISEFRELVREIIKEELNEQEKFIQKAIKRPGALSKRLGISEDETIPMTLINKEIAKLKKKSAGDKKLSADDLRFQKQLSFAKTLKTKI